MINARMAFLDLRSNDEQGADPQFARMAFGSWPNWG
jgi:hypothetical protein